MKTSERLIHQRRPRHPLDTAFAARKLLAFLTFVSSQEVCNASIKNDGQSAEKEGRVSSNYERRRKVYCEQDRQTVIISVIMGRQQRPHSRVSVKHTIRKQPQNYNAFPPARKTNNKTLAEQLEQQ